MINYLSGLSRLNKIFLVGLGLFVLVFVIPERIKIIYEDYFVDYTPTKVYKIVIRNQNKQVCQGGMLLYDVHFDKYRDYEYSIKRQLVDSYAIVFDVTYPPRKPLGLGIVHTGHVYVPKAAEVGDWYLRWTAEYKIPPHGSTRVETVYSITAHSDTFWVKDCDGDDKGIKGDKGEQGVQGKKGDTGARGERGLKGSRGD